MPGSFSDFLEAEYLDHHFNIGAFTAPTVHAVALYTAVPSDTGGGTEVTGGSYARVDAGNGASNWSRATSTITNDNNIDLGPATASWGTVVAFAIFDATTAGNFLMWDDFTGVLIDNTDTARFAATTGITVTLD